MDPIDLVLTHVPEHWIAVFVVGVVALRTLLRFACWFLRVVDLAWDGREDWTWVGRLSDVLDAIDSKLDWAVISALWPKPKQQSKEEA